MNKNRRDVSGLMRWMTGKPCFLPVAAFLLALGLRMTNLNASSLWIDEIYSLITANVHFQPGSLDALPHPAAWYAGQYLAWQPIRLPDLVALLKMNVHMPLYYLLLNPWLGLFGNDAVGLRSFSALFSALLVFPLAGLGSALGGRKAGIFTVLAAALLPFQIYYGQEGRMYALALFWTACSGLAFWKMLYGARRLPIWGVLYVLSLLGGFFTHYMFVFFLGFQAIYSLLWLGCFRHGLFHAGREDTDIFSPTNPVNSSGSDISGKTPPPAMRKRLLCLLIGWSVLFLAALGWYPVYRIQQQGLDADYHFAKGLLSPLRYLTVLIWQPFTMASGSNPLQRVFYLPIVLLLSVFAFLRRQSLKSGAFRREGFLLAWMLIPLLLQIAYDVLRQTHTSVTDRYVLLISPAVCLCLALGLSRLYAWRTKAGLTVLGLMALLGLAAVWNPSPFRDEHNKDKNIRRQIHAMARQARPGDLVFANGPWGTLGIAAYYLAVEKPAPSSQRVDPAQLPILYWVSPYRSQRLPLPLSGDLAPYRRVWLFRYRSNNERGLQRAKNYLHTLYPNLERPEGWFLYGR
jgi:hypothetical protein